MRALLVTFLLIFTQILESKPPELTPALTRGKFQEILRAHISSETLNPKLMNRIIVNFVDELDPIKTYFLEGEIVDWSSPSDEFVERTLASYRIDQWAHFEEIYALYARAVERRANIEQKIAKMELPSDVTYEEFKDVTWCENEQDLETRLLRLKALQMKAIDEEKAPLVSQRMDKRRQNHEQELLGQSMDERHKMMCATFLKAGCSALDYNTSYFTPNEAQQFMVDMQHRLFGIGAELRDDLSGLTLVRLLEGGPAKRSELLREGDQIVAVDGEPIIGMHIQEAVALIRGPKGTDVELTIMRDDETKHIKVTREEIVLNESRYEVKTEPFGDGVIGHLHLHTFYQDATTSSAQDLKSELVRLKKEHDLKGVVLDLRNNTGGLLAQAVNVAGLFMKNGVVASTKDNQGKVQRWRNLDPEITWDGPLVILTNRVTASAAEIVSQSMQEYGRAVVVGDDYTFGKGSFQTLTVDGTHSHKVDPQGEYKVTRGIYYTVSGNSPQLSGVSVDVEVPGILSTTEIGERFAKFPLDNDHIDPSFEDTLEDVHPLHRMRLRKSYLKDLQQPLTYLQGHLPKIKENSKSRIETNKSYQEFLESIRERDHKRLDEFELDLQLLEAMNVTKDLILFTST